MSNRSASTSVPITKAIAERWSPRAFSPEAVSSDDLTAVLEAARWAASCFGAEPWRFIVGVKGSGSGHANILESLVPANQSWAASAPVLMLSLAQENFERNGKPNNWAAHDVGLAVGQLGIEASSRGLFLHQMAGFVPDQASELLSIPEGYRAMAVIALGHMGKASDLPAELAEREADPRKRKALGEIAFRDSFGKPFA
ncbi:MAG: nitroreductase [Planctomycetota bacterium]|jgi:nitroreductase